MFPAIQFECWGLASSGETLSACFGSSSCRVQKMSNSWILFGVDAFELCWFLFRYIHFALEISILYNSTVYSTLFPFSSSLVLSPSSYILSHLSMIVGSIIGGLTYIHFHLYPHTTNPTNRCSFPYLANFMVTLAGLALSNFATSCSVIYILNSKLPSSTIPLRTPRTCNLHSTMVPKCFKVSVATFHPH
jgi:hypothetical protein